MCRLPTKLPQPKQYGQMCQKYRQQRQRITRTRRRPQATVQRNQSADCQQNRQVQRIRRCCNGAREKLHERGKGKPHERRRQQMYITTAGRLRINPTAVRRTQNWQRARHLPQENACRHIGKRAEKKDFFHVHAPLFLLHQPPGIYVERQRHQHYDFFQQAHFPARADIKIYRDIA